MARAGAVRLPWARASALHQQLRRHRHRNDGRLLAPDAGDADRAGDAIEFKFGKAACQEAAAKNRPLGLAADQTHKGQVGGLAPQALGDDVEVFGPLLRVAVCDTAEEMLEQCNATAFGLAAAVFTKSEPWTWMFVDGLRAGCINVNTGTAGASSRLPFGGVGLSGNHRPAGAFSVDYCAHPIAGMFERGDAFQRCPGMG